MDQLDIVRRQFGRHAEEYRKSRTHNDQDTLDNIIRLLSPSGAEKALDIGCGGGHMAATLAPWIRELVAIDVTPQMLVQTSLLARERGLSNLRTCLADAQNLPFSSKAFDIVSCRIVLHHVMEADKAIGEMRRVLKEDGKIVVQDILGADDRVARDYMDVIEKLRDPSHIKDYDLQEWDHFFVAGGLKVLHREMILGVYRLKEWTSRSGTPVENVNRIVSMLSEMPEEVRSYLRASFFAGDWSIPMRYVLILAKRA